MNIWMRGKEISELTNFPFGESCFEIYVVVGSHGKEGHILNLLRRSVIQVPQISIAHTFKNLAYRISADSDFLKLH